ncbi:MAG: 3-oxoacyl-[acyl-carrier protein] reductase [Pseudonocardiales bacterium]|nr:3-oxoacyl-[acyl-carrier protein] reductase [Pseudonocardiales bacterium]
MADRYLSLINSPLGENVASWLKLPRPAVLRRYEVGDPLLPGPLLLGGLGGRAESASGARELRDLLVNAGVSVVVATGAGGTGDPATAWADAAADPRWSALVFDATAATSVADLALLREFFAGGLRRLGASGRVVVLGRAPDGADPVQDATRQALDGIVRSLAKELRNGATANLVLLDTTEAGLAVVESAMRFLLSGRSAYVDGQVIRLGGAAVATPADWSRPLQGKVAVVTGAARGIGASIATVLARDGAQVVAADLPMAGESLARVANRIGGTSLQLDITSADAPERMINHANARFGGVDIVIHNAGITRDKLLANMKPAQWDSVLAVNLEAQLRINAALLQPGGLRSGGRVVCLASTSGIAGNRGQTNYAASKAGVIGMVRSFAQSFAEHEATINAVAPGFIETEMTAAMPFATREAARRLNSLQQGGQPVDVAEAVGWLSWSASGGMNGQVLRVCGQNLVGA